MVKAIIPTGGNGTRMRPLTFSSNKHFIPIANKPLIYYPIETVVSAGIKEIAITYNPQFQDLVRSVLGDGSRWGVKFTYILQEKPSGLANLIEICEEFVGEDLFLLHLGDNIFYDGISEFVKRLEKDKPEGLVPMVHHKENKRMGVPYFDSDGRLIKYVEKPENPPHDFAIPGLYLFNPTVFKCFKGEDKIVPSPRGELEISSPFQWLIDHKYHVDVLEYKGTWLDPGKFDDWIEANKYILREREKGKVESEVPSSTHISGNVSIGKNCQIVNSNVSGPVVIGDNVTIIDSVVGPYTSIDDNCEIEGSEIENSVLMKGVIMIKVPKKISTSLIGTDSEVMKSDKDMNLFVGEKTIIKV